MTGQPVMPPSGTKAACSRCGRAVWLLHLIAAPTTFRWHARADAHPSPLICPGADQWPDSHHEVVGYETTYRMGDYLGDWAP